MAYMPQERRPDAEIRTVFGERTRTGDSLAHLLARIDARDARAFVHEQLGTLAVYDREHGTTLLRVLEAALDHRDRNAAAGAAFMHRNTFRRQLGRALELAGVDLDSPEERLALQLALKLRAAGSGALRRAS